MDFKTRYEKLNDAQKRAVDTIDGPVMVIAGPGTGKTELLSMRAASILRRTDTLPESILCLTFTESGAQAMRERLRQIIGPAAYKIAIHTFHGFGTEIINRNGQYFYHGANFRPADELSSYEIIEGIFDELGYDNPLSVKLNGNYAYLQDTLAIISELKKSGLASDELLQVLDSNDAALDKIEPYFAEAFTARLSKATLLQLPALIKEARAAIAPLALRTITPLAQIIADSLETALQNAEATNSTKPITAWKNTWLKKNDKGLFVFKSRSASTKLRAVSYVYFQYLSRMQEAELYDFDDMILRVVHALEVFPELRFDLQEQYQYIMVDEFQDTNLAQMRILSSLTDNEALNGRPNILAVGDDDQAIYSFQGADVGNIHAFLTTFPATQLIPLVDNYRSTDTILSHARAVITLGENRFEKSIPSLDKTLIPHRNPQSTTVSLAELSSETNEQQWVVHQIQSLINGGVEPYTIAVLARRHHEIASLLPYFAAANIRVSYERRDNILEVEGVKTVELVARIIVALYEKRHTDADSLLPELISHPAFAIPPVEIWRLSLKAQQNHQPWQEVMSTLPLFQPIHTWLISLAAQVPHLPLEHLVDRILGNVNEETGYVSPFMQYFFSSEELAKNPERYLTHLEALRTIRTKLREYIPDETPTLQSFLEFIELHREIGSTITSLRQVAPHETSGVNLMTAHKSKGLEFEHVFIIGAVDSAWGERVRSRSRLIGYPENLPLAPAGDTFDERLRLFFVAMTRAKTYLTISYSLTGGSGHPLLPASFLSQPPWQPTVIQPALSPEAHIQAAERAWYEPLVQPLQTDTRDMLAPLLQTYKLSATHLCAFLDITRGGPQGFLLNYLLRFPQATAPQAAYGSAIHATLQRAHSHLTATGKQRPYEDILHDYEKLLAGYHLPDSDFTTYLQKGGNVLHSYLEAKYDTFTSSQKAELNFAGQSAFLGEAHLTGTLDLVDFTENNTIIITDYKTGRPARNWRGGSDYEKIKLHKYKQQLMFYQLLAANSRDYGKYSVEKGVIQFVEPTQQGEIIALEATFSSEDLLQFAQLLQAVWKHIVALNLPDTSVYEPTYKGLLDFETAILQHDA
jgi:DNA helicase II / ATP-dependent DNA helicase PcrA